VGQLPAFGIEKTLEPEQEEDVSGVVRRFVKKAETSAERRVMGTVMRVQVDNQV
jgi:hypothetical protein